MVLTVIIWIVVGILGIILLASSIYTVKQQTAAIIERFGKYAKTAGAGIHLKIPFGIDRVADRISLQINQLDLTVETKTKDDVFVVIKLAVQYLVPSIENVFDAYYKLSDPRKQMDAWVFDVVRAQVPTMKLDMVFENKKEIAEDVEDRLKTNMEQYGFKIVRALVNDIEPDAKVKAAMNEVNTQQRLQVAATAQGEKEKILVIKAAEAQKENKRLQGEGIAAERKAIMTGLKEALEDFKAGIPDATSNTAMSLLVLTQFFDTLQTFGKSNNGKVILLPSNPGAVGDWQSQIMSVLMAGNESQEIEKDDVIK